MPLLRTWSPLASMAEEMNRFRQEMNEAFSYWGGNGFGTPALAVTYPALNIWEDEGNVYAEAELPGIDLADLEILVTGENRLTLNGTRKEIKLPKETTWHRQERGLGSFTRMINLPATVNAGKVEARLEHGVLSIKMPKAEAAKPKTIPIKVG